MECNKDEARRAIDFAEKKISANDYEGAKKLVNKAQRLYPKLDGLGQVLMMIDVYISASNRDGEADWYGILGVDSSADDKAMKKQYKKLALLLHPDKNRFNGAEGAFKLVLQAFDILSDKPKRAAYDLKRKSEQVKQTKSSTTIPKTTTKPQEPNPKPKRETESSSSEQVKQTKSSTIPKTTPKPQEPNPKPKRETESSSSVQKYTWKPENANLFCTVCSNCNTCYECSRKFYLNKTSHCRRCGQDFVATEITPEMVNGRRVIRWNEFCHQFIRKSTSDASSSSSTSSSASKSTTWTTSASDREKTANQEVIRKWLEKSRKDFAAATQNANSSTCEAERLFKKRTTNSTFEEERQYKNPMTSGDANSTHEAERLFGNCRWNM